MGLLAKIKLLEEFRILRQIVPLHIVEQLAPTAGHGNQAAAGVEILPVSPEVLGQRVDPRCEQSNLNIAGAGVRIVNLELRDDILFFDLFWHIYSCCTARGAW